MSPSEPSARAGGYATGRATKSAIVTRAAEAFAVEGFHGASMRAIARAAGVDHSTLLHHFGDKTGLLMAVLEWHDAQSTPPDLIEAPERAAGIQSPEELVAGIRSAAEHNRTAPGLVRLLALLTAEAAAEGHPARAALQRRHDILRGILAGALQHQRDTGAIADDGLSPDQHAALLVSTWDGLQTYDALHPGQIDVPQLLEHALRTALGLARTAS